MSDITSVIYVPEVTYGTTPVDDPGWKTARFVRDNLGGRPVSVQSAEQRGDREPVAQILTNLDVGGSLDVEWSQVTFDDFLEALLGGTWTANVLKLGTTDRSFSIEREYVGLSRFAQFTGMRVASMTLNVTFGAIVTGSFVFAGNGAAKAATTAVGIGSVAAATAGRVLNGGNDLTVLNIDNAAVLFPVRSFTMNIDNNIQAITAIGTLAPTNQAVQAATINGTMEMYLDADSIDLFDSIIANTSVDLDFTLSDGTNTYAVALPQCYLSGDLPGSQGRTEPIIQTVEWSAAYDVTATYGIQITRT